MRRRSPTVQLVSLLNDAKVVIDRPRDQAQRPLSQDEGHVAINAGTPAIGEESRHPSSVKGEASTVASRAHRNR